MALLPDDSALQHEPSPRPLPLFLALVREVSESKPELARDALSGLRAYGSARRDAPPAPRPAVASVGGACLRDHGGAGPPAVLIPSLINPPRILDLDPGVSLANAVANIGRRTLLLDWGDAAQRSDLSVAGHVEQLLLPLLRDVGAEAALIGYCLGGTMALAAANLISCDRVATLACPWHFSHYPGRSRAGLQDMWTRSQLAAAALGALPMEVLQAAFWSLDPDRTVGKFAGFSRLPPDRPEARRFVELEDWANGGEPLPYPAARELIEDLFGRDLPGAGTWKVGQVAATDNLAVPALHLLAGTDRIAPAATAPRGERLTIDAGHVGMIVGSARAQLHRALAGFLTPLAAGAGCG
jgi:polyhydroxyalkanoate synthase